MTNYIRIESALIHGGVFGDALTHSVNVPIYQTSTYQQFELEGNPKWEYSRTGNPTRAALEALIAELEGGTHGLAFASGMAAITAVLQLFKTGDRVLISSNVYGGTYRVLDRVFKQFGLEYGIVDTSDSTAIEAAITDDVRAILIESPANPLMTVTDIAAVAALAKRKGILTFVDNTFMTPYLQRPLALGADIVIHSATKYLGGHSDLVAGLVVVKDDALAERLYFLQNATGGVLGPFDAFLLIRGIKTLAVRMDRHVENAERIAAWLADNDAVARVHYPGLPDDPGYAVNQRQAKNGGAMISFTLKDEYSFRTFFKSLKLITLAESLGGVESLACHPSTMTHASIPRDLRLKVGISDNLIRLSPGIEAAEDLINDLDQAIKASKEA
ncbi:MAG: PLP-dependent transferase [Clostridia bacterium]|nr:PLP-dependent transferase [Clostridia bacterium]